MGSQVFHSDKSFRKHGALRKSLCIGGSLRQRGSELKTGDLFGSVQTQMCVSQASPSPRDLSMAGRALWAVSPVLWGQLLDMILLITGTQNTRCSKA